MIRSAHRDAPAYETRAGSLLIPPGVWHSISNTGRGALVLLCCCSPAYRHEDTELQPTP